MRSLLLTMVLSMTMMAGEGCTAADEPRLSQVERGDEVFAIACPGAPLAFSGRRDRVAFICEDGAIRIATTAGADREIDNAFILTPVGFADTAEASIVFGLDLDDGPPALLRADLLTGRLDRVLLPSLPAGEYVVSAEVSADGTCLLVASGPRPSDAAAGAPGGLRPTVQQHRLRAYAAGQSLLKGAAFDGEPALTLDIVAAEALGLGSETGSIRCVSRDGRLTLVQGAHLASAPGEAQVWNVRIAMEGREPLVIARGADRYRIPSRLGAQAAALVNQETGSLALLDLHASRLTPVTLQDAHWIDFDVNSRTGVVEVLTGERRSLGVARCDIAEATCTVDTLAPWSAPGPFAVGLGAPGAGHIISYEAVSGGEGSRLYSPTQVWAR